ncbi:MAG: hypothetical protein ABI237_06025 [Ginsengibacter sp.]
MQKQTKTKELKQEETPEKSMSINDLKAEVYDRASMIEQYQIAIQKLQQEIQEVNKKIIEKQK